MAYSSIIELIGIRELAEDDPEQFILAIKQFKDQIIYSYNSAFKDAEEGAFKVHLFRDYCYIYCKDADKLLKYIKALRVNVLKHQEYLFRCVIVEGKLDMKIDIEPVQVGREYVKDVVYTYGYDTISSKLYGILERFKGAGIYIDEDLKKLFDEKKLGNNVFINYYVTDVGIRQYIQFYDIKMDEDDAVFDLTDIIIRVLNESRLISKKVARFYVPMLINMAFNVRLGTNDSEKRLNYYLSTSATDKFKDITGIELVYLKLLDRIFSDEQYLNRIINDTATWKLVEKISKTNWLIDVLRTDNKFSTIPSQIISHKTRRIVLRQLARIVADKNKTK